MHLLAWRVISFDSLSCPCWSDESEGFFVLHIICNRKPDDHDDDDDDRQMKATAVVPYNAFTTALQASVE